MEQTNKEFFQLTEQVANAFKVTKNQLKETTTRSFWANI